MAIENTLLLKVGGGLVAAGGTTGVGIAYKDNISKWFSEIIDGKKVDSNDAENIKEDDYLLVVGSKTNFSATADEEVYKTESNEKIKNYTCLFNSKQYECDIIKKIDDTNNNKKWVNTKSFFTDASIKNSWTKDDLKTEHSLFLLKINLVDKNDPDLSTNATISILQKNNNTDNTKKFAELTPIFSKKNNVLLNQTNLFLSKIKNFAIENTTNEYQIEANKTYKCGFFTTGQTPDLNFLQACSILKFANNQSTDTDKQYSELTFVGTETAITASDKLIKNNYYIVKFTNPVKTSDHLNKDLIYVEVEGSNPKKIINFSLITSSFEATQSDSKKLLLLVD